MDPQELENARLASSVQSYKRYIIDLHKLRPTTRMISKTEVMRIGMGVKTPAKLKNFTGDVVTRVMKDKNGNEYTHTVYSPLPKKPLFQRAGKKKQS